MNTLDAVVRDFRLRDVVQIKEIFKQAFSVPPWNLSLSDEFINNQWDQDRQRQRFRCLVALVNELVAGVIWWHSISLEELATERGDELRDFAGKFNSDIIWARELYVRPKLQRKGIGSLLKKYQLEEIHKNTPTLTLSRILEGNDTIISIIRKFGFLPTGIFTSAKGPKLKGKKHQYWYRFCY